jgi:pyruvate dehydrogenase (quinone)
MVDMLVDAGINVSMPLPETALILNDAVRKNGKIKWIHVRHEEVGAYAAAAGPSWTDWPAVQAVVVRTCTSD